MKYLLPFVLFFTLPVLNSSAANGASTYAQASLSTTLTVAQAAPATMVYWNISNPNSGTIYVQFFDAATTSGITLGTTAPKFWIAVPPTNGVTDGTSVPGIAFQSGVVIAATTTPTGNTAPGTAIPITLGLN
jgi:hypothetical protein